MLRRELALLLEKLLSETKEGEDLSLDAFAERVVSFSPNQDEIDEMLMRLETHGRSIGEAAKTSPQDRIARILAATRALKTELGRSPREGEVAERAGLTLGEVRATRLLLRVMRG